MKTIHLDMLMMMLVLSLFAISVNAQNTIITTSKAKTVTAGGKATCNATLKKKQTQQQVAQQPPSTLNPEPSTLTFKANGVSFKMIRVDGGTFTMGPTPEQENDAFDYEKPAHRVTLSSYYIGETEVTQALWMAVMGYNPSWFQGDDLPVEWVTWNDCQTFINKLDSITGKNFRLPTEAEWEFAARGGNRSKGYNYSGSNTLDNVAWYWENSGREPHPVKTKSPNELGIYDMSGNVCEWCMDWKGDYSSEPQTNPCGASSGSHRAGRGGGWSSPVVNCRVWGRYKNTSDDRNFYLGFRLALDKS